MAGHVARPDAVSGGSAFADADADPPHPSYDVLVSRAAPGEPERALLVIARAG